MSSTISINQVIANAKAELGISTTDEDMFFRMKVNEAIREIDALDCYVERNEAVEIVDRIGKLPDGFHTLIGAKIYCGNYWDRLVYIDYEFANECGCSSSSFSSSQYGSYLNVYKIINGNIHIAAGAPAISRISLGFWGLNKDKKTGLLVIQENWETTIKNFLCFAYCDKYEEKYSVRKIEKYWDRFQDGVASCRGQAAVRSWNRDRFLISITTFNQVNITPK